MVCPTNSVGVNATTNQINTSGYGYDSSGNMTNDGVNTLVYDAENRGTQVNGTPGTCSTATACYTYDGNGLRVKKAVTGGTTTVYIFTGLPAVAGSKVIAEYENASSASRTGLRDGAAPSSPTREYVYLGSPEASGLLAKFEGSSTTYFHQDHLSTRVLTDSTGTNIGQQGHFPFGESWYASGTSSKWLFTSYERDSESGNDYAMARYNVNRLGRFASPDPLGGTIDDPQSLNRYTYVGNDPINLTDPTGECWDDGSILDEGCQLLRLMLRPLGNNDGPSGLCMIEGMPAPCSVAYRAAVQCPNNNCTGIVAHQGPGGSIVLQQWVQPSQVSFSIAGGPENAGPISPGYWDTVAVAQFSGIPPGAASSGGFNSFLQWSKDFGIAFFTQTYRSSGETWGQCTDRAATATVSTLSGGLIKSDKEAAAEVAASALGVVGGLASIKMIPGTLGSSGGWVRPSSVLGLRLFGTRLGVAATRKGFQGLFAIGAAELGLRVGSSLTCIRIE